MTDYWGHKSEIGDKLGANPNFALKQPISSPFYVTSEKWFDVKVWSDGNNFQLLLFSKTQEVVKSTFVFFEDCVQFDRGKSGHSAEQASSHPISFYYGASILRVAVCNCFKGGIKIMKCLFFAICSVCLFFPSSPNNDSLARGSVHLTCLASTETRARPPLFRFDRIWAEKLSSPAMIICSRLWKLFARCSSGYLCCFDPGNGSSGSLSLVIVGKTRFWLVCFFNMKTKKIQKTTDDWKAKEMTF